MAAFLDQDPSLADGRGAHGIPLLAQAAAAGRLEVAELLLERGVAPGVRDYQGKTPLELAVRNGHAAGI